MLGKPWIYQMPIQALKETDFALIHERINSVFIVTRDEKLTLTDRNLH